MLFETIAYTREREILLGVKNFEIYPVQGIEIITINGFLFTLQNGLKIGIIIQNIFPSITT